MTLESKRTKTLPKNFEDTFDNAVKYAFKLLGYRDRSEKELQEKLARKGFSNGTINKTIDFFKEKGFINDRKLAAALRRDAVERRHLGKRGVRGLLLKRGLTGDVADTLSDDEDEAAYVDAARQLIEKKLRHLKQFDEETIKRRLWGLLARRGFSVENIRAAMKSFDIKEEQ
ncbi:MAG: regulatory protein RecX [Nitrospirota bacterium]